MKLILKDVWVIFLIKLPLLLTPLVKNGIWGQLWEQLLCQTLNHWFKTDWWKVYKTELALSEGKNPSPTEPYYQRLPQCQVPLPLSPLPMLSNGFTITVICWTEAEQKTGRQGEKEIHNPMHAGANLFVQGTWRFPEYLSYGSILSPWQ